MKINQFAIIASFLLIIGAVGAMGSMQQEDPPLRETCGESVYGTKSDSSNAGQPPKARVSLMPGERRVTPGQTEVLLVCVTNPKENTEPIEPMVIFYTDLNKPNKIYVIGRNVPFRTKNHVGEFSLQQPKSGVKGEKEGKGKDMVAGEIEPGEVVQYTIIASDIEERGKHRIRVRVEVPVFPNRSLRYLNYERASYVNVVCAPSCAIATGIESITQLWKKYGDTIIAVFVAILTIISLIITIVGPEKVRRKLLNGANSEKGDGPSNNN